MPMFSTQLRPALNGCPAARPKAPDFDIGRRVHLVSRMRAGWPRFPASNRVDMSLLKGIDRMRDILVENTERFAKGLPATNALLCGAARRASRPGKAAHASVNAALGKHAGL